MPHPLISIIVAIYNARQFLSACLTSIKEQTFSDWECICVDDGSLDDSVEIASDFSRIDSRFKVTRQENKGPGIARNTGMSHARGEYFTFVDADDLAHPQMIENLLKLIQIHGADLAVCSIVRFTNKNPFQGTSEPIASQTLSEKVYINDAPLLSGMIDWQMYRVHPFGKLYRRDIFGQLRFPGLYGAEDAYLSFDVYSRSHRAVFSTAQLYGYRFVKTGLTSSIVRYRNYIIGDARVALHGEDILNANKVAPETRDQIIATYIMRIYAYLNEMALDEYLSKYEKDELMILTMSSLERIQNKIGINRRSVPPIHLISYIAVKFRSLWLLSLWNKIKRFIPY